MNATKAAFVQVGDVPDQPTITVTNVPPDAPITWVNIDPLSVYTEYRWGKLVKVVEVGRGAHE